MEILITGSRKVDSTKQYERLKTELDKYQITKLLHGGAMGADSMAQRYADTKGIATEVIRPDYKNHYAKAAPLIRNKQLVAKAQKVIAIYAAGRKRQGGTWHTVQYAIKTGVPVVELMPSGERVETKAANTLF